MRQLIFLLCALPFLVGVDPQGLPEGILARFRGGSVSLAEYRDFLYLAQARSRLEELVEWKLLRQRAEELGQPAGPEEIARRVEAERGKILQGRYKGDRKAMTATFLHQGYSPAEMARWMAFAQEKRLLQDRIVRASRKLTDPVVKREFERLFGLDGVRVRVRQIQVSLAPFLEAELKRGLSIDQIDRRALEKKVMARGRRIRARLERGEAFGLVCSEESDDPVARAAGRDPAGRRRAGLVKDYNYQRYGPEFARAVQGLKEGEVAGPVPFRSEGNLISCHVILLEERRVTRLEDVREKVVRSIKQAPVDFYDRLELKERLFARYGVETRKSLAGADARNPR